MILIKRFVAVLGQKIVCRDRPIQERCGVGATGFSEACVSLAGLFSLVGGGRRRAGRSADPDGKAVEGIGFPPPPQGWLRPIMSDEENKVARPRRKGVRKRPSRQAASELQTYRNEEDDAHESLLVNDTSESSIEKHLPNHGEFSYLYFRPSV